MRPKEDGGYGGGTSTKTAVSKTVTFTGPSKTTVRQSTATTSSHAYTKSKSSASGSLTTDKNPVASIDIKKSSGLSNRSKSGGGSDTVVKFYETSGKEDDNQRSRLRYVNRNLPPLFMSVAQYGRRNVPRKWR